MTTLTLTSGTSVPVAWLNRSTEQDQAGQASGEEAATRPGAFFVSSEFMAYSYGQWGMWWRIGAFGPGVQALHKDEEPSFSERYGYRRFWRVPFTPYRVRLMGPARWMY